MKPYRAYCTVWQSDFAILVFGLILILSGCNGTRFIFSSSKDIVRTPEALGLSYEEIWFATQDDLQLHGWFVPGEPKKPLVLVFLGNAANISSLVNNLQYFHEIGFSTFIFDYRGFGQSQGQATREEDLYADARSAISYLRDRGWSSSQIIYYGHSMGAAVSLQMGLEFPPAAVVMESPFTNMTDIAWHTAPVTYALIGWWAIRARFDNINKIEKLPVAVVIIQGDEDQVVPAEMAQRLYERATQPKTIYLIPGGGHNNLYQVGGKKYRSAWLELSRQVMSSEQKKPVHPRPLKQADLDQS